MPLACVAVEHSPHARARTRTFTSLHGTHTHTYAEASQTQMCKICRRHRAACSRCAASGACYRTPFAKSSHAVETCSQVQQLQIYLRSTRPDFTRCACGLCAYISSSVHLGTCAHRTSVRTHTGAPVCTLKHAHAHTFASMQCVHIADVKTRRCVLARVG